jgi:hypothetical protein
VLGAGVEENSATVSVAPPLLGGTHAEVGGDSAGMGSAQAVDAALKFLYVLKFVSHQHTCAVGPISPIRKGSVQTEPFNSTPPYSRTPPVQDKEEKMPYGYTVLASPFLLYASFEPFGMQHWLYFAP